MKLDPKTIKAFQKEILTWYAKHQRELPWREIPFDTSLKQRDPYKILVSEVMLQQTQVSRVIPKYEAWLKRFPDVSSLAKASTADVLRLWSGLGYNRRALYLQKTAKEIIKLRIANSELEGWPRTPEELEKLPGIGKYTASAIACFAFDEKIAVVDTNVRRVILTQFLKGSKETKETQETKVIQEIADQLLPKGKAYEWNQALMDYAAVMLRKEKIPIKKQSTFVGSNRYYRGQTVKLLLQYKEVSIQYLVDSLAKDKAFIKKIVAGLEKDGMVVRKKDEVKLA